MTTPDFTDTVLHGGLPCMVAGTGPPLVVLPGLSAEHGHPTGLDRRMQLGPVRSMTHLFTVHVVNLRPGLSPTTTMRELAADVAAAIEHEFAGPVAMMGTSTGGSVAQQVAVDQPDRVRRLVLVAAACRLSPEGRAVQRRLAEATQAGRPRAAWAAMGPALTSNRISGRLMAALLWLTGGSSDPEDPTDMLATIRAEDAFDVCDDLHRITAPTLIIAGGRDGFYSTELFEQTARNIPGARLMLYPHRGHVGVITSSAARDQILHFLSADLTAGSQIPRSTVRNPTAPPSHASR
jgi:pimeloyl-ACP methyl ester carboxylesterase